MFGFFDEKLQNMNKYTIFDDIFGISYDLGPKNRPNVVILAEFGFFGSLGGSQITVHRLVNDYSGTD